MANPNEAEYVCITTVRNPGGVINNHIAYLFPSETDPWIQDCLHRAGPDGKTIVGNVTIHYKDGTSSVYMVNVEPPDVPISLTLDAQATARHYADLVPEPDRSDEAEYYEAEVEGPMAALGTHRCQVCGQLYLTEVGARNCAEEDRKRHPSVPGWTPKS
jgi:hypothetical protein